MTTDPTAPTLPGYRWLRRLGSGGFADVHLYHQATPARRVAVKVLRDAGDTYGREALEREANAMARVSGHPAIVSLFAAGTTDDGRSYLAMEFCPVATLGSRVRNRPMPVAQVLEMMIQICGGVEMVHRSGLVHRDIKPANIMRNAWDRPVLSDFGVTSPIGQAPHGWDGFSLQWAPPEQQMVGTPAHPTQDVWALAATTWTLAQGRSPFVAATGDNSEQAVAARVKTGQPTAAPDLPPSLGAVLQRAMRVDPGGRTPSAAALGLELARVQSSLGQANTAMEVPGWALEPEEQPGDDRTRLRSVITPITVAPQPPRTVTDDDRTRLRFGVAGPAAPTTVARPQPEPAVPDDPEPEEPPVQAARPRTTALVATGLVAILAGGVVVASLLQEGATVRIAPTTASVNPANPVRPAPAPVTNLHSRLQNGHVYWLWEHPGEDGLRYHYTLSIAGKGQPTKDTAVTLVDVGKVSGRVCIEVVATSADGASSDPVQGCVTAP